MKCLFNKSGECDKEACFGYIKARSGVVNKGTPDAFVLQDTPEGCKVFTDSRLTVGFLSGLMGERR